MHTWDFVVAEELAAMATGYLVFVATDEAPGWDAPVFELGSDLGIADKLRWLSAIAEEAGNDLGTDDVRVLEAWWTQARRATPRAVLSLEGVNEAGRAVLECLALAGRSLPRTLFMTLGDDAMDAVTSLIERGAVQKNGALVSLSPDCDATRLADSATEGVRCAAARMLASAGPGFDPDPWSYARAAELLLSTHAIDAADAAFGKAVRGLEDPKAASEIGRRWFDAIVPITGAEGVDLRLRASRRALDAGDPNEALRWCESAQALGFHEPSIALLTGRALIQLGDLVAARISLQRAESSATTDEHRARAAAELAEIGYLVGEHDEATSSAKRAVALGASATRLAGRNTIGKILLAQSRWDEADAHFATDALDAAAAGEVTAELRARLNRGIALMCKGLIDEAQALLERVLAEGTALGATDARAHALSNLANIAYRRHRFGEALRLLEQTIQMPPMLRGRIASAQTIGNLADLRLRLGLVDHADHAVAFGRRSLGPSTTKARASHFSVVAAGIALARRNTELARREIETAIADGEVAGNRDYLSQAHRMATRIALDDGDLATAAQSLAKAEALATRARAKAEVAILRAAHVRALGQNAIDAACEALRLTKEAGEEDLLGEIYVLLATLYRDAGEQQLAKAHCARAIAVRDQVAEGLPTDIRSAFLAKPDMLALSRLQSALANQTADADDDTARSGPDTLPPPRTLSSREIIGDDPQIRTLMVAIRKVARATSTVLISGESGTGKELVAEALHRASDRANGPLVSVNCAALVETLLLSELFGHEKGAFTGASQRRRGRFELAEGGTLFLDEIGDISPRTQVALLRVLQEKTFERVGGANAIRSNVRVICATHRDLRAMVERGEFREDLYYRLRGITLEVPALRARLGDLPKIAAHLLDRIAQERNEQPKPLSADALDLLARHRWPGNIRELENVLRAVSLFAEGEVIQATDLLDNVDELRTLAQSGPMSQGPISLRPSLIALPSPSSAEDVVASSEDECAEPLPLGESDATAVAYAQVRQGAVSLSDMKRQIERDCIARALEETKGNITRAAALLGMKRPRLSQLVKQYGLSASSSEGSQ